MVNYNYKEYIDHAKKNLIWKYVIPQDTFDHKWWKTLVLTPWLGCTSNVLSSLGEDLREHFNIVYAPNFPLYNTQWVNLSARMLADKIRTINEDDISIMGHSLGGLIAVEVVRIATDIKINNVIAMGSPFLSVPLSKGISNILPACQDINKKGGYHKNTKIWHKIDWRVITYVSEKDMIVPKTSQIPNTNIAPWKTRVFLFNDFNHWDFIINKTLAQVTSITNHLL